jgi:hypothetical protein
MNKILILLFLLLSLSSFSQDKKAEKAYEYYLNGNTKKAEKLCSKLLNKNPDLPQALYIQGLILIDEARNEKSQGRAYREINNALLKRNTISSTNEFYEILGDSIHTFVLLQLENDRLKKREQEKYKRFLAKEFGDTFVLSNGSNPILRSPSRKNGYPQDSLRNNLLLFAQNLEGVPYKWAGTDPNSGFDCSGFTQYVYQSIGIELPHNAQMQSELIKNQKPLEEALPGDLIFFGSRNKKSFRTQHAGIVYSKEGENIEVIHCVSNGVNIDGENSSWDQYWSDKVLFVIDLLSYMELMKIN